MDKTVFALKVLGANDDGLVELKKAIAKNNNIHFIEENGQFIVYPIDDDVSSIFSENAFEIGADSTNLELVTVNTEDNSVTPSTELIEKLKNNTDIEFDGNVFQMAYIDTVVEYVSSNELKPEVHSRDSPKGASQDGEKKPIGFDQDDGSEDGDIDLAKEFGGESVPPSEEAKENNDSTEPEGFEDNDLNQEFDDSSKPESEEKPNDNQKPFEDEKSELPAEQTAEQTYLPEQKGTGTPIKDASSFFDGVFDDENEEESPLSSAKDLFSKQALVTMPEASDDMPESMKEAIYKAQNNISSKQQEIISIISQKINKANKFEYQKLEENQLKEATNKHEDVLSKIDKNILSKQSDSEKKRKRDYSDQKESAISVQVAQLKREYDQNHLQELNQLLSEDHQHFIDEGNIQKDNENDKYDEYLEQSKKSAFQTALRKVDIEPELESFRKFVKVQIESINDFCKQFDAYQKDVQSKLNQKDNTILELQKTTDERVKSSVERASAKDSQQILKLQQQLDKATKDLDTERNKNNLLTDLKLAKPQNSVDRTEPEEVTGKVITQKKESKGNYHLMLVMNLAMAVVVIFTCLYLVFKPSNPVTTTPTQPQVQQTQPSNNSVNSSDTNNKKTMKKGDTFVYTKPDGSQVKVTVDSANSGHYVDDEGNSQTVTF